MKRCEFIPGQIWPNNNGIHINAHGSRILLRDFCNDDYPAVIEWLCDEKVMEQFGKTLSKDEAKSYVQKRVAEQKSDSRKAYHFIAVLKSENVPIGDFSLFLINDLFRPDCGSLGYRIASKYWNQGLATEALKLLLDFGFHKLNLHKISSGTTLNNLPSQRVMEKANMSKEAHLREHNYLNGQWHDMLEYSIINLRR
jgi:RimJ/RimL family protein N-acetyltransferase